MSSFEPNKHHLRELLIKLFNLKKSASDEHRLLVKHQRQSPKPNRDMKNILSKRYAKLFNPNLIKIVKRKDEYVKKRYTPLLWTRLVEKITTIEVSLPYVKNNNIVLDDNDFKKSNNNVMEISNVMEKIIQNTNRMINDRKWNRSFRKINKSMTNKRLKRSANDDINLSEEITNNSKLYRHPKLNQEDEQSKITDPNANVYTDFYKRIWKIINGTRPTFKIVVPPMKRTHREIFKDENVKSGSEIDDLNLPYNKTGSLNEKKNTFIEVPFDERREEDEFDKYVKVDMENIDNCSTLNPIVESKNEKIIINPDVIYNPDESYIDSNDTKDLSENKKSSIFLREPTVKPFVESKISNPDEVSYVDFKDTGNLSKNKPTNDDDDDDNDDDDDDSGKVEKYTFSSSMPVKKLDNNKLALPPVPDYDPDKIPYVEIPDYSDEREESLDEEDRRRAKEKYIETVTTSSNVYSEKSNNKNVNKDQNISTRDNTNIKLLETSDHAKKNLLNHRKKNYENVKNQPEIKKKPNEEFIKPEINFDINEYNKPFDLDDFLKNEPFFQKFKKNNKNNNNKRDNDKELVDDTKIKYSSDEWKPRYESANQNSHKDHMKLDDYMMDEEKTDEMINEEKDFLDRYFTKDVIDKLEEDSDEELREETKRKEKEENDKEETLKTLSKILEKKDRISRLDEEVNKNIEDDRKKVPSVYKNYWSLEYELPGMKDTKRDEENIN